MTERETEAEREIREQRWKRVGERSREGEGGEQNKMERARKWRLKTRRMMTRDIVRKAKNEREFPSSESSHSGLEGPAAICYSTGATLQKGWHRGEAGIP